MLVDHHCHLDFAQFTKDRDAVVQRAHDAGVGIMVSISTKMAYLDNLTELVSGYDHVYCSAGTHPHYANRELHLTVEDYVKATAHPRVVAIGEAGLDYFYDHAPRDSQETGFRRQIEVARQTGLPLIIHARDADEDTASILEQEMAQGPFTAVLHCYTGGPDLASRALDLGLYVSFTGVVTFNKMNDLRAIMRSIPDNRILVETDAPFLPPVPHRGKRNEPSFVRHTAELMAAERGVSLEEFAAQTTANFFNLYTKVPRTLYTSAQHAAE
ncbi:MAG: TatD family hydrolase [Pseudomonadota bacterium]